jgi:DNA polymerase III subunit gamma/tau
VSSLALYRTYRPGRFADVVGQDHVTGPLTRALEKDRVHHAYLFSGPRGCGKTSSARILARSLNCEKGPTPEPCGECRSCTDLAPNGPGSIDVVELDAATHGLVDDARELREKAHFAPVSSQFKIYIIDEAHQLGPGAANALLKLIEEPPAHLKFIFATTAPDKILPTIRSRTFHYPFRLIPARILQDNLAGICEREGVPIEPAALALVARAGAGSARDAQSVLGQLIAGSGEAGVTYEIAVALLGFTDTALLDEVVDAIAAGDGATVFVGIDRVMDSGHDPRRFLTDLLERFRDLVVVRSVPDAFSSGLIEAPDDEAERLAAQAARFGPADLVRLADVVDEGITAMKGATPTRLQLELVCARLLLPGADDTTRGVQARLDRLERRITLAPGTGGAASGTGEAPDEARQPAPAAGAGPPAQPAATPEGTDLPGRTARPQRAAPTATEPVAQPAHAPAGPPAGPPTGGEPSRTAPAEESSGAPAVASPSQDSTAGQTSGTPAAGEPSPAPAAPAIQPTGPPAVPSSQSTAPAGASGAAEVRRLWPEVLVRLREIKRTPWSLISQEATVVEVSDGVLTLAFRQPTLRDTFARREDFQDNLRQAISDVLGVDLRVNAIVDPSAGGGAEPGAGAAGGSSGGGSGRGASVPPPPDAGPLPGSAGGALPKSTNPGPDGAPRAAAPAANARAAVRASVSDPAPRQDRPTDHADHGADPNDSDVDESGLSERELLERTLGAKVIEEIDHT